MNTLNIFLALCFVVLCLGTVVIASNRMSTFAKYMGTAIMLCVAALLIGNALTVNFPKYAQIVIPFFLIGGMFLFDIYSILSIRSDGVNEIPAKENDIPEHYE